MRASNGLQTVLGEESASFIWSLLGSAIGQRVKFVFNLKDLVANWHRRHKRDFMTPIHNNKSQIEISQKSNECEGSLIRVRAQLGS